MAKQRQSDPRQLDMFGMPRGTELALPNKRLKASKPPPTTNFALRSVFEFGLAELVKIVKERWIGPKRRSGINWSQMIRDLEHAGMKLSDIGMRCGQKKANARSWAHRIKNLPGTEPRILHGAALLVLWMEKTGQQAADAPKED
tara:strand:+ start:3904 stop:4335 length:432 start_codon:yes stop_codon:yes gene_type:complete